MPTPVARLRLLTPRDLDILTALDHCPLTASQLLKLSETFSQPFTDERRVRARLQILSDTGRVRRWQYATAGRGAPNYYTLSSLCYQLFHGEGSVTLSKRAFEAVPLARQTHTQGLAEFLVHTMVAAYRIGVAFTNFYRENTLRLQIGEELLFPDGAFQLIEAGGEELNFFLEIDGGSERVRSPKDADSWERKLRLYDRLQDLSPKRFRVLAVSLRSRARTTHILDAAAKLLRNPRRSLVYGVDLATYLATGDPLRSPCFRDHRGHAVSVLPASVRRAIPQPVESLTASVRGTPPRGLPSTPTQAPG